jgi:hypothetical protein
MSYTDDSWITSFVSRPLNRPYKGPMMGSQIKSTNTAHFEVE